MVVRTKLLGFLALVILFGWTNRVAAQVSDDVTSRIEQARTMMLQMRLTDASLLLDMPGLNPEEQGLIWFQKGYIPLLEVLLTDREQAYDAFFTYSDAARSFLDGQPNTSWFNWLRAEVVMQRAWVWAKRGDNVRAALAFNAAYQFLDRVKKEGSSNSELQKGLGLMHLAIGALPSRYRTILRMFGFSGSLDQGLGELKLAATTSRWNRLEAIILLATVDKYGIPSQVLAQDAYQELWAEYQPSPLIALLYADVLIRLRDPERAIEILNEAIDYEEKSNQSRITYLRFFRAEAAFRLRDCPAAVRDFESYDRLQEGLSLKATAYLMAGLCEESAGNRKEAVEWFKKVTFSRGFTEEEAAIRTAKRLLNLPMSQGEKAVFYAVHLYDSGQDIAAIEAFRTVLESPTLTTDERVQAQFGLALVLEQNNGVDEALVLYRQVFYSEVDPLGKWKAYALLNSANVYAERGQVQLAEEIYEQLIDLPGDFDYKSSIQNQARLYKRQLKN